MDASGQSSAQVVQRPGFVAGLRSLLSGFGFLLRNPRSWPLAAVPLLVLFVLVSALSAAALVWLPGLVERLVGTPTSTWGSIGTALLTALSMVAALVLSLVVAFGLAQPLSGPALEGLIRQQERALGAPERPPTSFWLDVWRSLQSLLLGYAIGLPLLAILFLVTLLVPPATIVTTPLKVIVMAFTVAWDLCDYPLTVHGLPVSERFRTIWRYRGAVLGFGVALALGSLLPCVLFLCLPAGVVGAGRLVWQIEQFEASKVAGS
ncbi:MAG: EI24 domain-containing protein [Deltaproteobacteria bacterium]|jgi:CysZ protein|nr:EI24 domain-containing protein [Deltaproteobacteria bacterium]MBW2531698.1 EI24 domain-containing protein [Deltaproteobacteria bacterium]